MALQQWFFVEEFFVLKSSPKETSKEDDLEFLKLVLVINSFYVSKAEAGSTEKKEW